MKYCKNCNQVFSDNAQYCGKCGSLLESAIEYDIFGEPMEKKEYVRPNPQVERGYRVPNGGVRVLSEEEIRDRSLKYLEILSLISIGLMLVPLYGTIFCVVSTIRNIATYSKYKKGLPYVIISIITLILSFVFIYLLARFGVLADLFKEVVIEE